MTRVLVADADRVSRTRLAALLREQTDALVYEAEDGPEALRIGLQLRPAVALLDLDLPRLGGPDVARTLRNLEPWMRIALHGSDPRALHDRASGLGLPLLEKVDTDALVEWAVAEIRRWTAHRDGGRLSLRT
jgi:CheY-like chemotaxis protein